MMKSIMSSCLNTIFRINGMARMVWGVGAGTGGRVGQDLLWKGNKKV